MAIENKSNWYIVLAKEARVREKSIDFEGKIKIVSIEWLENKRIEEVSKA